MAAGYEIGIVRTFRGFCLTFM